MVVKVAVGIILRNNQVFLALRKPNQHQGGLWEFPGGKCEAEELVDVALIRELSEECGIRAIQPEFFREISHNYGDKTVKLFFYKVTKFDGEPLGKEGQEVRWVSIQNLSSYDFPEANKLIVDDLLLLV